MKLAPILALLLLFFALNAPAQDSSQIKHLLLKVNIKSLKSSKYNGFLATMNDSAVYISTQKLKFTFAHLNISNLHEISYHDIETVVIQRKKSGSRGFLFGAVGSFIVLESYILLSADQQHVYNFTTPQRTLFIAVPGSILGGLIGAIIGAWIHKTFVINGMQTNFQNMKSKMTEMYAL
jgi:hypothetical protein